MTRKLSSQQISFISQSISMTYFLYTVGHETWTVKGVFVMIWAVLDPFAEICFLTHEKQMVRGQITPRIDCEMCVSSCGRACCIQLTLEPKRKSYILHRQHTLCSWCEAHQTQRKNSIWKSVIVHSNNVKGEQGGILPKTQHHIQHE